MRLHFRRAMAFWDIIILASILKETVLLPGLVTTGADRDRDHLRVLCTIISLRLQDTGVVEVAVVVAILYYQVEPVAIMAWINISFIHRIIQMGFTMLRITMRLVVMHR